MSRQLRRQQYGRAQVGTVAQNIPCFGPRQWRSRLMSIADTQVAGPRWPWEALQPAEFLTASQAIGEPGTHSDPLG